MNSTQTITPAAVHPARFYPVPCYCACSLAHPATLGICDAENAETSRDVSGVPVPLCVPCALALDARPPRGWA